jgi:outer membrane receptor protein involved in Fe transport
MRQFYSWIVILFVCSQAVWAGSTGKIAGNIKDSQSGEALVGASVLIQGTTMGSATNLDGYYVILNIPPGKYTLVVSAVGYHKKTIADVSVSIDLTTSIDVPLASTVLEVGEEVVVTATRPLVQKDLTASTAIVGSEQISALPVTEVSQVLNLQAGYVAGSLRGGRSGEVAYWIDGVPVTDAFNGTQVVEVNKNLIQEAQLVSGAFNAEYGQAMSGIINIATKEGGAKYTGQISVYMGDYLIDGKSDSLFPGNLTFNPSHIRNFEANLSGPIIGNDLTFFANGRYIFFTGWLKGVNRYNPWNVSYFDSANNFHPFRDSSGLGDGSIVPMNSSERWYGQGKLTWHVNPTIKATLNYIYDYTVSRPYGSFNTGFRSYFYDPNGMGQDHNRSNTFIFQFNHVLSSNTFYTLGASYFVKEYQYYLYKNMNDSGYVHPLIGTTPDGYSFQVGGADLRHTYRSTKTFLAKLDLSSQLSESHLIKTGVEFRQNTLYFENIQLQPIDSQTSFNALSSSPYIQTQILPISSLSHDLYYHSPKEFSAYIQDKMEYKDLIVNIGIRFDYFAPDATVLNDDHPDPSDPLYYTYTVDDPNIYNPIKPGNRFWDNNRNGEQDPGEPDKTVADRMAYWYKKATSKWALSPRIGFSFPITARGVVHFSYGHFFQIPHFELMYQNPQFKIDPSTTSVIGNADLKPEQTINGELGIQQQLTDDISADLTAYLRDIRNLTGTRASIISVFGGSLQYARFTNSDFGLIKGIALSVTKRFSGGITATLDYTYSVAKGTASDPNQAVNAAKGGQQPEVQLTSLNWDQRHTLNGTVAYNGGHWGASLIGQYGSGTPYTPRATEDITSLLTNSQTKPSFFNIDMQAFYEIPVDPLRIVAFVRVINLFDIRNESDVFNDSGRAGFTIDEATARNSRAKEYVNSLDQWFTIPTHYSEPRRIEVGMNLEF